MKDDTCVFFWINNGKVNFECGRTKLDSIVEIFLRDKILNQITIK